MMHLSQKLFFYFVLLLVSILLPFTVNAESTNITANDSDSSAEINDFSDDASSYDDGEVFSEETPEFEEPPEEESFFSFLDTPQEFIGTGVDAFAQTLDEFFSEDKVFYDSSGSFLQLIQDIHWLENGGVQYNRDIRLKIRLPHTSKKIKLIAQSNAEDRTDDTTSQTSSPSVDKIEDKETLAGLEAEIEKSGWGIKPSIGYRISEREPYVKLRLSKRFQFKTWSIYLNETPYWFYNKGSGYDTLLEFNNKISNKDLFRATSFARRTHETGYFELSQSFSVLHTFSDRRAASFYIAGFGVSKPTVQTTHYVLGFNYRQKVHKDYLFFEVVPQITYQKENNFNPEHSVLFRIEFIFKK